MPVRYLMIVLSSKIATAASRPHSLVSGTHGVLFETSRLFHERFSSILDKRGHRKIGSRERCLLLVFVFVNLALAIAGLDRPVELVTNQDYALVEWKADLFKILLNL